MWLFTCFVRLKVVSYCSYRIMFVHQADVQIADSVGFLVKISPFFVCECAVRLINERPAYPSVNTTNRKMALLLWSVGVQQCLMGKLQQDFKATWSPNSTDWPSYFLHINIVRYDPDIRDLQLVKTNRKWNKCLMGNQICCLETAKEFWDFYQEIYQILTRTHIQGCTTR